MFRVCLFVMVVVLRRLVQELGKGCHVRRSWRRRFPFAAGNSLLDLLEQPFIPVRIFERGKRVVGTTLRISPGAAWVFRGVVEHAVGVMKDFAHFDAVIDQVSARGVDVVYGEDEVVSPARLG